MDNKNEMNQPDWRKPLALAALTIGVLLCTPIVGFVGGLGYFAAESSGAFESWQPLGTPPERAIKILSIQGKVYVKTIGERIYSCDALSRTECWMETTLPQEIPPEDQFHCEGAPPIQVPNPPGKVVDSLGSQVCGAETVSQSNFVLLEDGSLWIWHHNFDVYDLLFFPFCGVVLGLLGGVVISILIWLRQMANAKRKV